VPENVAGKLRTTATVMHFAQWGLLCWRTLSSQHVNTVAGESELEQMHSSYLPGVKQRAVDV